LGRSLHTRWPRVTSGWSNRSLASSAPLRNWSTCDRPSAGTPVA